MGTSPHPIQMYFQQQPQGQLLNGQPYVIQQIYQYPPPPPLLQPIVEHRPSCAWRCAKCVLWVVGLLFMLFVVECVAAVFPGGPFMSMLGYFVGITLGMTIIGFLIKCCGSKINQSVPMGVASTTFQPGISLPQSMAGSTVATQTYQPSPGAMITPGGHPVGILVGSQGPQMEMHGFNPIPALSSAPPQWLEAQPGTGPFPTQSYPVQPPVAPNSDAPPPYEE